MDEAILFWINLGWAGKWLDIFFLWITDREKFGFPFLGVLLIVLVWRYRLDGLKVLLMMVLLVGIGDAVGSVLKDTLQHPRPCYEISEQVRRPEYPDRRPCSGETSGMPSNHALNFFTMAAYIAFATRSVKWAVPMFAVATAVAISRIYLGVHYPSQVFVGMLLGFFLGASAGWGGGRFFAFAERVATAELKM